MAGGISYSVSVQGLSELIGRLKTAPSKMGIYMNEAMKETLRALQENVPAYPPERMGQKYIRTERLGQSMGSGFGGGAMGKPDIFEVTMSGGAIEGKFGTRVGYAEYVIGEGTQAWMHTGRWWTVKTILNNTMKLINSIWQRVGTMIAAYVNGKG